MKELLVEQNLHWSGNTQRACVKRDKLAQLVEYLPLRQIITISGIRRCGKSTLTRLAIEHLITNGTNPKNILFVNLEQPCFLEYRHNPAYLNTIFEEYLKLIDPQGKVFVVFDEIQFFDSWQVYIKSKYETSDIKFIITGSNSSMLSNELTTLLGGRSVNIHLDTFSFGEFLDYKNIAWSSELERVVNKIAIHRAKEEYLRWGGFFEVFTTESQLIKKEILTGYAKNIIYQDIIPRYGIRNSEVVERLFFYLLSNIGGVLNYTTIAKTFDMSDKSIKEYINYFEDVFLLRRIDKFHTKQKEQIKSSKKIYALDNGFLQITPKNSANLGAGLENWVFIELNRTNDKLFYIKEVQEIDFCCDSMLFQVSFDISDEKTRKREIGAFESFKTPQNLPCTLITFDTNEKIDGVDVVSIDEFIRVLAK